jgi:hypothetical protein
MSLIIDTYNVLHVTGVLPPEIAGIDTAGLIDLIRHSRYRHRRTTLVCDGRGGEGAPTGRIGPVTVRYGGPGPTADALIAAIIRRSSSPRRLTIVSSDRAVQREARRRRCEVLNSEQFLEHLTADHEQAVATGAERANRLPRPAAPSVESTSPSSEGGSAAEAVFPADLLREAESILRQGLPKEPASAQAASEAGATPADEQPAQSDRQPTERLDDESDQSAPKPTGQPALPLSLVREALAMTEAERGTQARHAPPRPDRSPAGPADKADRPEGEVAETGHAAAEEPARAERDFDLPADLPSEDILPADIIREAESLLNDDPAPGETDIPGEDDETRPPRASDASPED